ELRRKNPAPPPPPRSGEGEKDVLLPLSASGRGRGGGVLHTLSLFVLVLVLEIPVEVVLIAQVDPRAGTQYQDMLESVRTHAMRERVENFLPATGVLERAIDVQGLAILAELELFRAFARIDVAKENLRLVVIGVRR